MCAFGVRHEIDLADTAAAYMDSENFFHIDRPFVSLRFEDNALCRAQISGQRSLRAFPTQYTACAHRSDPIGEG